MANMDINNYYQEDYIEKNICRWNLNVYNCRDEAYFRSIYYIKLVVAVCVSLLDSVLIIYRIGIKRRNIFTPYGMASIDGLLIFTTLYSYGKFYFYFFLSLIKFYIDKYIYNSNNKNIYHFQCI